MSTMLSDGSDPFDLERFVTAQADVYERALKEIRSGAKRSHWMWFIFPQLVGLGHSSMAEHYAIGSPAEAKAYLDHPLLGERYQACVVALQDLGAMHAETVFGAIDAIKLRSSLTLFAHVSHNLLYDAAIQRWFGGGDPVTLRLLRAGFESFSCPAIGCGSAADHSDGSDDRPGG